MQMQILRTGDSDQWTSALAESLQYDFYHLPGYHALAESRGEGIGHLLVFREQDYCIALPLLLRSVDTVEGLEGAGNGWKDATSVYGYAGPVASHAEIPALVLAKFRRALRETLLGMGVVSVFSRLHPLFAQQSLLSGLGDHVGQGQTVSVDLTEPLDVQRANYRRNHRRNIQTLEKIGVTCIRDERLEYLHDFVGLYHEAMRRVHAEESYFFDESYFANLASCLGEAMQLFVCRLEGEVICGGFFTALNSIAQAHLAGALDKYVDLSSPKLLYDRVSLWARERGCRIFHLGGGVGAQTDSVFYFKAGFSDRRHEFSTWRWVIDPQVYKRLCEEKARWNDRKGLRFVSTDFFPEYWCSTMSPAPSYDGQSGHALFRASRVPVPCGTQKQAIPMKGEKGIVVIGAGGHAKVILSTLTACGRWVAGVFDDDATKWGSKALGARISPLERERGGSAIIGIGDNRRRMELARTLNFQWEIAVHPNACVDLSVQLGPGSVVFAGVIVQPDTVIGEHVILNTGATIDHDCIIADFTHIAPGVRLAGGVEIGEGAFLGIGCSVIPGVKIGRWSTVGAGAVVIRDVPEGAVVLGVPARVLKS